MAAMKRFQLAEAVSGWEGSSVTSLRRPYQGGRRAVLILALLAAGLTGVVCGQVATEFPIPTANTQPQAIVVGPDDNLWFTEYFAAQIGRITTAGVITELPVPSFPEQIAAGPDGNLWFTEHLVNKIGRITTDGVVTEFPIPTASSLLGGIAAGSDGNLWFAEIDGNQIGRITTAGVITEFPIPTFSSVPNGIVAGPDGNLWFAEEDANKIGRITTAGVITEFAIPTASSGPFGIAAGPDGNLWFAESGFPSSDVAQIGRITTAGVVTEFPVPTAASHPVGIVAGSDGNLWFTESGFAPGPPPPFGVFPESNDGKIGRITVTGVVTEFPVPTANSSPFGITAGPDGNLWFTEVKGNQIGRITTGPTTPQSLAVDARTVTGSNSNANGVLEPGETVQVAPSWTNTLTDPQTFTGIASNLGGPGGPTYTLDDGSADYGSVNAGATGDCNGATGDCYLMTVSGARPAAHWDATFTEDLSSNSVTKTWTLHVGESFPDVPTSNQFYGFIENLFHNGVTGGCASGNYCPDSGVTRAQMAVFLMKGKLGASQTPSSATGTVFGDVHVGDFAADWIEQLAGFQITGGCGGGNYCPNNPVTRAQMAVFLLKAAHGSAYTPPDCTGVFTDVECTPTPAFAVNWIEQLATEGITGGCGGGNFCPENPNTRGQMAVFLVKTFGLQLYGP